MLINVSRGPCDCRTECCCCLHFGQTMTLSTISNSNRVVVTLISSHACPYEWETEINSFYITRKYFLYTHEKAIGKLILVPSWHHDSNAKSLSDCVCRERNCLLKEAEVLHKARFNYIIQIFGVCNEPEFFCIVTEYMSNGSLDQLLHDVGLHTLSKNSVHV